MTPGRLVAIDRSNWQRSLTVRVDDAQLAFVAESQPIALIIIAKAYVGFGGWAWEALAYETDDGEIVAVLGLAHHGLLGQINNFAVDVAQQGRGIGRAALDAVIKLARDRNWKSIRLALHPDNVAADRLYRSAGFVATGELMNGEPILELTIT